MGDISEHHQPLACGGTVSSYFGAVKQQAWDQAAQLHTLLPHQGQPSPPGAPPAKRRKPGWAGVGVGTAVTHVEAGEKSPGPPLSVLAMGTDRK